MRRNLGRYFVSGVAALALVTAATGDAAAQETGTPVFKAPYRAFTNHEFGASLSDPGNVSFALEGFYRYGRGANDFSVRAGCADPEGEDADTRLLLGGDFRTQVLSYTEAFPLDGSLTVGLGTNIGDGDDLFYIPVGISLGRRFNLEGTETTFIPYVHPVIVPVLGGANDDVEFALGLGVDIRFARDWAVRASGGIGEIEGVGISVTYVR